MELGGLECVAKFYIGGGSEDCAMFREFVECYGGVWNVTVKTKST